MTYVQATVGMVATFGPITLRDLAGMTGWKMCATYRRVDRVIKQGHVQRRNVDGRRCLVLARPVCVEGLVL